METVLLPGFLRSIRGESLLIRSKGFFNCLCFSTNIFRSVKRVHLQQLKGCNVLFIIYRYMKGTPFANRRRLVSIRKGHLSLHPSCLHSTKSRQDGVRKQPFDLCYTFGCHTFPDAPLLISSDWLRAIMIISSCNQLVLQITFILLGKFLNQTLLIGFRFLDAHISFFLPATSQALMDS